MKNTNKILIIDDEEGIRESLKLVLEDHYNLMLTDNAEECMRILKNSNDIGLVLMDIKMPKVNGLELLEMVKDARPDVNVIMVTGYKSVETATEATRLGASSYIVKPFESSEILEKVKNNFKG